MIVTCPGCKQDSEAPRAAVGKNVRCPVCGRVFPAHLPQAIVLDARDGGGAKAGERGRTVPGPGPSRRELLLGRKGDADKDEVILTGEPVDEGIPAAPAGAGPAPKAAPSRGPAERPGSPADALAALASGKAPSPSALKPPPAKVGWYVTTMKGEVGPVTSKQLIAAARRGEIRPETQVRNSRSSDRVLASKLPGLFPQKGPPAPRTPAPAAQAPGPGEKPSAPRTPAPAAEKPGPGEKPSAPQTPSAPKPAPPKPLPAPPQAPPAGKPKPAETDAAVEALSTGKTAPEETSAAAEALAAVVKAREQEGGKAAVPASPRDVISP